MIVAIVFKWKLKMHHGETSMITHEINRVSVNTFFQSGKDRSILTIRFEPPTGLSYSLRKNGPRAGHFRNNRIFKFVCVTLSHVKTLINIRKTFDLTSRHAAARCHSQINQREHYRMRCT